MPDPDQNPEHDPKIADAAQLFGDTASEPMPSTPRGMSVNPSDGYAIEEIGMEPEPEAVTPAVPPAAVRSTKRVGSEEKRPKAKVAFISSGVDETWSRGAEWGVTLIRLGGGILASAFLLWLTFNASAITLSLLVLLVCLVGLTALAYPILITLERPVRMTPEQALKDYFNAFSHLMPHTKRMWLLLATDGRKSYSCENYSEFDAHWKKRLDAWKAGLGAKAFLNPFEMELLTFKAEKSGGQTEIEAKYSARLIVRGEPSRVIETFSGSIRTVRGPDKMWYLDSNPTS